MKRSLVTLIVVLGLLMLPTLAMAGEWEGTIQGLQCATEGKVCPVDMEDPMVALEKSFVLVVKPGEFYTIPNIDRALLARALNRTVKVTGDQVGKYNAINAKQIEIKTADGKWKLVWNLAIQKKLMDRLEWNY